MVDTPTTRNRFRKQEVGTNNNTWGTNLNQVLDCVDQVTDGWQSIALTSSADYTLVTTNYTTADEAKNRGLYFTGTLSSAVNAIIPSVAHQYTSKNASGVTLTLKTSAGTGVAIPNSRQCDVFCDAANVLHGSANWIGNWVPTLANDGDVVVKYTLEAAIANASFPATAGTVLVTASDTTAKYLQTALVEGTGIDLTLTSLGSGSQSITLTVDTTELTEFTALTGALTGTITSGTTAMIDRSRYKLTGGTATLPTMAAGSFSIVEMAPAAGTTVTVARNSQTIDGASTDDTFLGVGGVGPVIMYEYVSAGVVTSRLVGGSPF